MIALTATPPKTALAVFGVRVDTAGDYKGESPLESFGYFGAGQSNCHALKNNQYRYVENDTVSESYKHIKAFCKLTF